LHRLKEWDSTASVELRGLRFDDAARRIEAIDRLTPMSSNNDELRNSLREGAAKRSSILAELERSVPNPIVFVGHGRSLLWNLVTRFLKDDLRLPAEDWESQPRTGFTSVQVLQSVLERATFAVMVVTAEDQAAEDRVRARQNVVHEIGLLQGRLGFNRVAILMQDGVEEFSNLAGLQTIPFKDNEIRATFHELRRTLVREGLIES
jgi:predicted nucleotide-binding protein